MERAVIITGIKSALSEVLQDEVGYVTEETSLFDDLYLDSAVLLELLMALEDVLDIEVDSQNLTMETFQTVGSLADYVAAMPRAVGESVPSAAGA